MPVVLIFQGEITPLKFLRPLPPCKMCMMQTGEDTHYIRKKIIGTVGKIRIIKGTRSFHEIDIAYFLTGFFVIMCPKN